MIFSAGSDREIRRWLVTSTSASQIDAAEPIIEHETSVYKLRFDADDDLWTASADGTVKCLVRERGWKADTVLQHPDFVRDVIVGERWVVTACRDEGVRVWDRGVCVFSLFTSLGKDLGNSGLMMEIDSKTPSHILRPLRRSHRPRLSRPHSRERQYRRNDKTMVSKTRRFRESA